MVYYNCFTCQEALNHSEGFSDQMIFMELLLSAELDADK